MTARRVVIVGAGQAGRRTAETLRALNADIAITMVGEEPHPPYDRPPLSKAALTGDVAPEALLARPREDYASRGIMLRTGVAVIAIDRPGRSVALADGTVLAYDVLVLATGSSVRRLLVPGAEDDAVHYLRTLEDALRLRSALRAGGRVAVVGGGLIGLEVAASARTLGCEVTVLEAADRLMARCVPDVAAAEIARLHRQNGVRLLFGTVLRAIARTGSGLRLECADNSLEADLVVAGIGAVPNLSLVAGTELAATEGIPADPSGRTADPAIHAAGEVAAVAMPGCGRLRRVESWQMAELQPVAVAHSICGLDARHKQPTWFWSDQFDWNIQVMGAFDAADTELVMRRHDDRRFALSAIDREGGIHGAVVVNSGREASILRRAIEAGAILRRDLFQHPNRVIELAHT